MTSKQRKLKYIREKNHYRFGGSSSTTIKVHKELLEDKEFINKYIDSRAEQSIDHLERMFKMNFQLIDTEIGIMNDDYIRNLKTILLTFKKKNQ